MKRFYLAKLSGYEGCDLCQLLSDHVLGDLICVDCLLSSLGMQDSWGPLKVLAIASLVNLFGDILLCTVLGYGIAGAAWATMASQVCSLYFLIDQQTICVNLGAECTQLPI